MLLDAINQLLLRVVEYPYLLILATLWLTYSYVIFKGGHVSDDLQGIEQYDGTLMYPVEDKDGNTKNDEKGQVIKGPKICYGTLSKWVRNKLTGGNTPSRHRYKLPDGKLGEPIPNGKVSQHHHTMSVVFQSIACILLYQFLLTITTPTVALMTTLLFVVHPTCLQAVAWPSAIGYVLSLICITASLNISHWIYLHPDLNHIVIGLAGLAFFQVWGVYAQAIPMFTWVILLVLGQWQMALLALGFSGLTASINLREYVVHRKSEFKKQHMAESTSFNLKKPIVALKTLAYYLYLSVWPAKLGLYHKWGFHYDKKIESIDWRALVGLIFIGASAYFFPHAPLEVRVGLVWFVVFLTLFLNWITAQQWVTERYLYIPVIGLCLIASFYLQNFMPIYYIIFGLFMCRSLVHMPTYKHELNFYLSNTWNFQDSEVAYGNLGVAYASAGLAGASNDMWVISGSINPDYDVPFYNIFSRTKSQAMLMIQNGAYEQGLQSLINSIPMLEKVLACKVLHFPDMWKKELDELKNIVSNPITLLLNELSRLHNLRAVMNTELSKTTDQKRISELMPSINNNDNQINNLTNFLASKGVSIDFNPDPKKMLMEKLFNKGA